MGDVSFEEFKKLDIRVAKVVRVEEIEGADMLLKLTLDVGELGTRNIAAGIKGFYQAKDLKGKFIVYLANLEPRLIRGVESQGMLLAADDLGKPVILQPGEKVTQGAKIR